MEEGVSQRKRAGLSCVLQSRYSRRYGVGHCESGRGGPQNELRVYSVLRFFLIKVVGRLKSPSEYIYFPPFATIPPPTLLARFRLGSLEVF